MSDPSDYQSNVVSFSDRMSTPGPALKSGGGGGTSGPMEPWQQTVETRLGELRQDTRTISSDLGAVKVDLATLKANLAQLPSKGFIAATVLGGFAILGGASIFGAQVKALLGLH
jgi:hypothetical protein